METPLKSFRRHPLSLSVLLAALFVRALVPVGFMPAKGELVELCTLHGVRMVLADPETGELLTDESQQSAPACPWSLLLTALAAPSAPALHWARSPDASPITLLPPPQSGRPSLALPPARAPPPPRPA
jgi:hypothetical protein